MIDDDVATLEAILADDLTYGHSSGVVDTKAAYLEALRSGKTKYLSFDRLQSAVRVYGETAVVTGTATLSLRGQAAPFTLRYTLVYVLRDRQWRMVAWQSTRFPNERGSQVHRFTGSRFTGSGSQVLGFTGSEPVNP